MSLHRNNSCANYIASVSGWVLGRAALILPALHSVIQSLSDTACILDSEKTPKHISIVPFLSLFRSRIPHSSDNAYAHDDQAPQLQSLSMSLVGLNCTAITWILGQVFFFFLAEFNSSNLTHLILKLLTAHQSKQISNRNVFGIKLSSKLFHSKDFSDSLHFFFYVMWKIKDMLCYVLGIHCEEGRVSDGAIQRDFAAKYLPLAYFKNSPMHLFA